MTSLSSSSSSTLTSSSSSSSTTTSSVLDRVKLFLPVIKKANEDLEELIKKEGNDNVRIDRDLLNNGSNSSSNNKIIVLDGINDSKVNDMDMNILSSNSDNDDDMNENEFNNDNKTIQLEFALGIQSILILN